MKALIIFHSRYGQTRKIADRIAAVLSAAEAAVETIEFGKPGSDRSLEAYDTIIVGDPIYTTTHSAKLAKFIKARQAELVGKQTGFFSVSLAAAGREEQRADARKCMDEFLEKCHWDPTHKTIFAGGLPYRKYGWFTRSIMKRIVRGAGGDTDTSKNHEYTKWNKVDQFANRFHPALTR